MQENQATMILRLGPEFVNETDGGRSRSSFRLVRGAGTQIVSECAGTRAQSPSAKADHISS
jgi:hypothetical protein